MPEMPKPKCHHGNHWDDCDPCDTKPKRKTEKKRDVD